MEKENEPRPISKVAIVGGEGTIGSVIQKELNGYELTSFDLPNLDARDYPALLDTIKGYDAIVHLALIHSKETDDRDTKKSFYDPGNSLMNYNIYKAAVEGNVKRVIMASSVHADNFYDWKGPGKLSANNTPSPTSIYGAEKVFMETMGRYFASKGLEVVCVRFGGINTQNKRPKHKPRESAVWLSHEDCASMINACLSADKVPGNYSLFYAVSNNKDRVHDTSNPFGWTPK